jgi:hypothetical protein
LEIHWWLSSREFRDVLGGHNSARLEEDLEAVHVEVVVWGGGAMGAEIDFVR